MKRDITVISLVLTIIILYGVKIALENKFAVRGKELEVLQAEVQAMHTQNEYLKADILQAQALTTLNEKARQQGFIEAEYYRL